MLVHWWSGHVAKYTAYLDSVSCMKSISVLFVVPGQSLFVLAISVFVTQAIHMLRIAKTLIPINW